MMCFISRSIKQERKPTNAHRYSIKTYSKSLKVSVNEKKTNILAWKVLGILPMTLGNKDSLLFKFVFQILKE